MLSLPRWHSDLQGKACLSKDCETVTSNASVVCVLLSPSPQWPLWGKDVQSLVRHITLVEELAHLWLQIKLVWPKCQCPTRCPPLCFLLLQLLVPEWMSQQLLNCCYLSFKYYSKFTLAPVFFHILACKMQQFKSWLFSALRLLFLATDWIIPG